MRIVALLGLISFTVACVTPADVGRCSLTPDELAVLKSNVRSYLRNELGDTYTYYDTQDSILDSVRPEGESCGILIYPGGDSDDGSSLLHGEGVVLFDRASLAPLKVEIFVW